METKEFLSNWNYHKCLSQLFSARFIEYICYRSTAIKIVLNLTVRGSTSDVRIWRRQILGFKIDPRAVMVKLLAICMNVYSDPFRYDSSFIFSFISYFNDYAYGISSAVCASDHTAFPSQKAVSADLESKEILHFGFTRQQISIWCLCYSSIPSVFILSYSRGFRSCVLTTCYNDRMSVLGLQ